MKPVTLTLTLALMAGSLAFADSSSTPHSAESAFDQLIRLEGTWVGESVTVPVGKDREEGTASESTVTFETIANDTSVVATFLEGSPMEMVSVYHMDGPDTLIHTHYCAAGNQPSMTFEATDEPGVIKWVFTRGTNMDVTKDGHAHDGHFRIIDENTFESVTNIWSGGKTTAVRYATMKRQTQDTTD